MEPCIFKSRILGNEKYVHGHKQKSNTIYIAELFVDIEGNTMRQVPSNYELVYFTLENGEKRFLPTYGRYGYLDLLDRLVDE